MNWLYFLKTLNELMPLKIIKTTTTTTHLPPLSLYVFRFIIQSKVLFFFNFFKIIQTSDIINSQEMQQISIMH